MLVQCALVFCITKIFLLYITDKYIEITSEFVTEVKMFSISTSISGKRQVRCGNLEMCATV